MDQSLSLFVLKVIFIKLYLNYDVINLITL
jgi:hypothetical protein